MLKRIVEYVDNRYEQMGNFSRKMKSKSNGNIRNKKENIMEMKNVFNGFISRPDRAKVGLKSVNLKIG